MILISNLLFYLSLEIDLRYEARNLERFRQNFLDVDFVKFPTPLWPLVTADVLVETFEVRIAGCGCDGSSEKAPRRPWQGGVSF